VSNTNLAEVLKLRWFMVSILEQRSQIGVCHLSNTVASFPHSQRGVSLFALPSFARFLGFGAARTVQ